MFAAVSTIAGFRLASAQLVQGLHDPRLIQYLELRSEKLTEHDQELARSLPEYGVLTFIHCRMCLYLRQPVYLNLVEFILQSKFSQSTLGFFQGLFREPVGWINVDMDRKLQTRCACKA